MDTTVLCTRSAMQGIGGASVFCITGMRGENTGRRRHLENLQTIGRQRLVPHRRRRHSAGSRRLPWRTQGSDVWNDGRTMHRRCTGRPEAYKRHFTAVSPMDNGLVPTRCRENARVLSSPSISPSLARQILAITGHRRQAITCRTASNSKKCNGYSAYAQRRIGGGFTPSACRNRNSPSHGATRHMTMAGIAA